MSNISCWNFFTNEAQKIYVTRLNGSGHTGQQITLIWGRREQLQGRDADKCASVHFLTVFVVVCAALYLMRSCLAVIRVEQCFDFWF